MNALTYYRAEIDGKLIGFHNQTKFIIQIGKDKSSYKTKHKFTGNVYKAISKYEALSLCKGSKKRLVMIGTKHSLLKRDKR